MIFHNTKLINLWETAVSFFYLYCWLFLFPRREMQTTSRYASRTSASLGEGYSFIALRFGTCRMPITNHPTSACSWNSTKGVSACCPGRFRPTSSIWGKRTGSTSSPAMSIATTAHWAGLPRKRTTRTQRTRREPSASEMRWKAHLEQPREFTEPTTSERNLTKRLTLG